LIKTNYIRWADREIPSVLVRVANPISSIIAIEKPAGITYTKISSSSEPECQRSKWIFDIAKFSHGPIPSRRFRNCHSILGVSKQGGTGCAGTSRVRQKGSAKSHGNKFRSSAMTETTADTKAAPNRLLLLWSSVIGKKVVMAVTGAVLVLFVISHMVGNLKIFSGAEEINAYSRFLRTVAMPELGYGQLLWIVRGILLLSVILHIVAATQLTIMNREARPVGYGTKKNVETTWGALTMRWGGVLLAIFIVFHLFHLTAGMVGFQPGQFEHLAVYQNVVAAFNVVPISLFYIIAMFALCLHLDHGIWSGLQTLGWVNLTNTKMLRAISRVIALIIFVGFISVPISVLAGWVR
jgi:succinate dehydrogenase / fumarate reductase cytochrome b subunit